MLQSESLSRLTNIRHRFFTREGGVSSGIYESLNGGLGSQDDAGKVNENRARMAASLEVRPDNFVTCYQVHSPNVVVAEAPWTRANAPSADAIVTRVPGLAIGVTTADCGPVLFADAGAGVVGAAHAGWKGALTGVIEATLTAMEQLGAQRWRMSVALGPMIRQFNYEVGPEFRAQFVLADRENASFFAPSARDGHSQFDLAGYIARRLNRAGIAAIDDIGCCTYADAMRFFSYRRSVHRGEPDYGRHVNAIALTP